MQYVQLFYTNLMQAHCNLTCIATTGLLTTAVSQPDLDYSVRVAGDESAVALCQGPDIVVRLKMSVQTPVIVAVSTGGLPHRDTIAGSC